MTKEKALEQLNDCLKIQDDDMELSHIKADDTLCELLVSLGHKDVVDVYRKITKYCA